MGGKEKKDRTLARCGDCVSYCEYHPLRWVAPNPRQVIGPWCRKRRRRVNPGWLACREKESLAEKLIEQVGEVICSYFHWGKHHAHQPGDDVWGCAREIVARIGRAYASGEIKLPGEKWRQQYGPKEVIIALRPEEEK